MNVTPLIDVLLVLLIIFQLIAPGKSWGLRADAPQPAPESGSPPRETVVIVGESGELRLNSRPVSWDELEPDLKRVFAMRPESVLFVAGAKRTAFEHIARVIDIAQGAGIARVALLPGEH